MRLHSVSVRKDKGMAKLYTREGKLYIDYMVDGERKRKSTKLDDTKENRTIVERTIIPKLMQMIATGEIHKKKPKTFEHYYRIFLKRRVGNSSYNLKKYQWDKANEHFGSIDVDKITRFEIKNYLNDLPMMNRSKGAYRTLFREVFEMAIDDMVITTNPAMNIRMQSEDKSDIGYFSKDEVKLLLSKADGVMKPYLMLAFHTGMRPEEILGLQVGDFNNGMIGIKRVRTRGMVRHPKTRSSIRTIPCPDFVTNEVMKYQSDNIFIFGNYNDVMKMYARWKSLLIECNMEYKRLYSTRHTFATTLLRDGIVSINELAGLLGHSTTQTTLTHYASVIDSKKLNFERDFNVFGSISTQRESSHCEKPYK